jgi:hypothetical protein
MKSVFTSYDSDVGDVCCNPFFEYCSVMAFKMDRAASRTSD